MPRGRRFSAVAMHRLRGAFGVVRYGDRMDTKTSPAEPTTPPDTRGCTRCDGSQHLVASVEGMGKYRCDTCELVVGFDLWADTVEFLIDRGQPGLYTRERFGPVLMGPERRL